MVLELLILKIFVTFLRRQDHFQVARSWIYDFMPKGSKLDERNRRGNLQIKG